MTMQWMREALNSLATPDTESQDAVQLRSKELLRPLGSMQRMDEIATWMAAWQRTARPQASRVVATVFASDHGVSAAGVSAYPSNLFQPMLDAHRAGRSTVGAFAHVVGATVHAVDVGIGRPTGDIRTQSAMDQDRFDEASTLGRDSVMELDADLLVIGEIGVGNTTAAAAVAAALAGGEVAAWVGRGTGVDDAGLQRKQLAVREALTRIVGILDPLEVLREVGGADMVAMAAAILAARQRRLPVVIDGYVVTSAALPLTLLNDSAIDHCLVGHCSTEPGHRRLLDRMHKEPLLDLHMRLGEGTGAMAAVPIIQMACAGVSDVPTLAEWMERP